MPQRHGRANLKALPNPGTSSYSERTMKTSSDLRSAYGAAILRVALGSVMVAHAAVKYFLFTLPGTASYFAQHGFPGWTAYPVFLLEGVGGMLLVLGWQVRWISSLLVPVMIGASIALAPNGWVFNAPNGGWEFPAFLALALTAQALLGAGAFALSGRASSRGVQ